MSGPCVYLSSVSSLSKHGKSSFILAIHKANIVAHAADDQSLHTFLCGKSRAIWVVQHSFATWPECSLEPSSRSGCTLFLCCFTTLIQRNSWKVVLLTQSWVNNWLIWSPESCILLMKDQHGLFFHAHFAKSAFCGRNITSLSSHAAPALAVNVFNVLAM